MATLNFDTDLAGFPRDTMIEALNAEGVDAVTCVGTVVNKSPRLALDWNGPKVMWSETIRHSGTEPHAADLPGTETKIARSIGIPWNFVDDTSGITDQIVAAFREIGKNMATLRQTA